MTTPSIRAKLALLVPDRGLVVELGVAAGEFAAAMLTANPLIQYVGIDKWDDHHDNLEMMTARERLRPWNAYLIRDTFAGAVQKWGDSNLADMIYIDGYAHTGQEGGQTLRDWWPKLKPGGIFAGHDYDPKHYPQTVAAVDAFVLEHRLALNIIHEKPHASWWLLKPEPEKP